MDSYEEIKVIGRGNYGTALLVRQTSTGYQLVVKKIPLVALSAKERNDAQSECKLLSKLRHPNILEYVDSFIQDDALHIVTQYCEGGDLARLIEEQKAKPTGVRMFDEDTILDWFIQITMAVDHIHSLRILHRDLKTGNVFLTNTNVIKLGDFGIAKVLDSTLEQANTVIGTPYYMSPEVCENKPYDFKSDLWAVGCILYELCTLNHAFDATNLLGLVFKIVSETYPPIPDNYSSDLRDLIRRLLSKDAHKRPSCRRIFGMSFIKQRLEALAEASTLGHQPSRPVKTAHGRRPSLGGGAGGTAAVITTRRPSTLSIVSSVGECGGGNGSINGSIGRERTGTSASIGPISERADLDGDEQKRGGVLHHEPDTSQHYRHSHHEHRHHEHRHDATVSFVQLPERSSNTGVSATAVGGNRRAGVPRSVSGNSIDVSGSHARLNRASHSMGGGREEYGKEGGRSRAESAMQPSSAGLDELPSSLANENMLSGADAHYQQHQPPRQRQVQPQSQPEQQQQQQQQQQQPLGTHRVKTRSKVPMTHGRSASIGMLNLDELRTRRASTSGVPSQLHRAHQVTSHQQQPQQQQQQHIPRGRADSTRSRANSAASSTGGGEGGLRSSGGSKDVLNSAQSRLQRTNAKRRNSLLFRQTPASTANASLSGLDGGNNSPGRSSAGGSFQRHPELVNNEGELNRRNEFDSDSDVDDHLSGENEYAGTPKSTKFSAHPRSENTRISTPSGGESVSLERASSPSTPTGGVGFGGLVSFNDVSTGGGWDNASSSAVAGSGNGPLHSGRQHLLRRAMSTGSGSKIIARPHTTQSSLSHHQQHTPLSQSKEEQLGGGGGFAQVGPRRRASTATPTINRRFSLGYIREVGILDSGGVVLGGRMGNSALDGTDVGASNSSAGSGGFPGVGELDMVDGHEAGSDSPRQHQWYQQQPTTAQRPTSRLVRAKSAYAFSTGGHRRMSSRGSAVTDQVPAQQQALPPSRPRQSSLSTQNQYDHLAFEDRPIRSSGRYVLEDNGSGINLNSVSTSSDTLNLLKSERARTDSVGTTASTATQSTSGGAHTRTGSRSSVAALQPTDHKRRTNRGTILKRYTSGSSAGAGVGGAGVGDEGEYSDDFESDGNSSSSTTDGSSNSSNDIGSTSSLESNVEDVEYRAQRRGSPSGGASTTDSRREADEDDVHKVLEECRRRARIDTDESVPGLPRHSHSELNIGANRNGSIENNPNPNPNPNLQRHLIRRRSMGILNVRPSSPLGNSARELLNNDSSCNSSSNLSSNSDRLGGDRSNSPRQINNIPSAPPNRHLYRGRSSTQISSTRHNGSSKSPAGGGGNGYNSNINNGYYGGVGVGKHKEKQAGPHWEMIVESMRQRLIKIMGLHDFNKVYSYLKNAHVEAAEAVKQPNASVPSSDQLQEKSAAQQKRLEGIVGKGDQLKHCFDVDQLIYIEETYLSA